MKHVNVALFVPDEGCPHQCSFCNQKTISGQVKRLATAEIDEAVKIALDGKESVCDGEIAFFGGSFTGIEKSYMTELLECAYKYVKKGFFKGIRISTRPDYISDEVLIHLKNYGVTSIELGCQSMNDDVLKMNNRGHSSADIEKACKKIKEYGFELGVQMMTGLYGDTDENCIETACKLISLKPSTTRIYPTVVLENTELASLYNLGLYKPQTLEDAVTLCSKLLCMFEEAGIKVIRLGLHSGGNVEDGYLAGAYHPAFAELCKSKIYLNKTLEKLKNISEKEATVEVASKYYSQFVGQKRSNIKYLENLGYRINIIRNDDLKEYEIIIKN